MMNNGWNNPQNPYDSFMVQASAGSGKTYQLSRRFLNLVAAGAKPSQILTLTFTVKAANEMRSRIISDASKILVDKREQEKFDEQLKGFYKEIKQKNGSKISKVAPILNAKDVARVILSSTQLLKVSTIDSLFKEWVAKFPWESSFGSNHKIASHFSMLDQIDFEDLNNQAWLDLFNNKETLTDIDEAWKILHQTTPGVGPIVLGNHIKELFRYRTYLWKSQFENQTSPFSPLNLHKIDPSLKTTRDVVNYLKKELLALSQETKRFDELAEAIHQLDYEKLVTLRLLTKDGKVHRGTFRGKKQDVFKNEIQLIDDLFTHFHNNLKIDSLNKLGGAYYRLYEHWIAQREKIKSRKNILEFNDLTMNCYRLFYGESGTGALWLLQQSIRHILLDEFQDTNLLQWSIFEKLSSELLSGLGTYETDGIVPTVFIVGDKKQSIYGFREADPIVVDLASQTLSKFNKISLPLNNSYRTSQVILDFINDVFTPIFDDFPFHKTATYDNGQAFIPNHGRITVSEEFEDDDIKSGLEKESEFIAQYIKNALEDSKKHQVWDKNKRTYRKLVPSDCCILYRNATHVGTFEHAFRTLNIPYRVEENKGFFDRCEIKDLLAFLHYLAHPHDIVSLFQVFKSPIFSFHDHEILKIMQSVYEKNINKNEYIFKIHEEIKNSYPKISASLLTFMERSRESLPHLIVCQLYKEFSILTKYEIAYKHAEGKLAKKNLIRLLDIISELESEGATSLPILLSKIKKLSENIELATAKEKYNAVTFMTIHKSKGLEFPFIILVEAADPWFKGDRYWMKNYDKNCGISFIGTRTLQPVNHVIFENLLKSQSLQARKETERLLYVALTRASQYLLVTGHKPHKNSADSFLKDLLVIAQNKGINDVYDKHQVFTIENISKNDVCLQEEKSEGIKVKNFFEYIPVSERSVPCEVEIIQPHKNNRDSHSSLLNRSLPPQISAAIGTFIHEGLENFENFSEWNAEEAWDRLVRNHGFSKRFLWNEEQWQAAFQNANSEISNTLNHPIWIEWHNKAIKICREMNIVHLDKNKLIRGSIDLFLEFEDKILVVDFKTSHLEYGIETQLDKKSIIEQCKERGYQNQLWAYSNAIRKMYPNKNIQGIIWLTKINNFIELMFIKKMSPLLLKDKP